RRLPVFPPSSKEFPPAVPISLLSLGEHYLLEVGELSWKIGGSVCPLIFLFGQVCEGVEICFKRFVQDITVTFKPAGVELLQHGGKWHRSVVFASVAVIVILHRI